MRTIGCLVLCVFMFDNTSAQVLPARFITKTVNFGKVREELGKISYDFVFFNKGDAPLRIEKVVPSCGCTATEYTQLAIPQDSTGRVRIIYNTVNRPGEINKTVSVYFSGYEKPEILYLKGIVIGNQRIVEKELAYPFGSLRFQSKTLHMGTIRIKEPQKREFEFYNAGKKDIEIKGLKYDSTFLKIVIGKQVLKPKELGKLRLTYDGAARKDWGFVSDTVFLVTSDDSLPNKPIPVTAHLEEYFPPMDVYASDRAPKIKFEKTDQHMGTTKEGATVSFNYKFTNEGKEDLLIRKIIPACSCLTFGTPTYMIHPGESSYVRVTMDTKDREGVQNKYITVISNSPASPTVNLWMRMNVAK